MNNREGRKESAQHQTTRFMLTIHSHEDGEICPCSIGLVCPLSDIYDQPEPGELPPGMKLPNGLTMQALLGGGGGIGMGGFNGMMMGPGMYGGGDMNSMMASMLAMTSGMEGMESMGQFGGMADNFDMSGMMSGLEGDAAGMMHAMGPAAFLNPMAAMTTMVPGGNPMAAMAAMAAAAQGGGNLMAVMATGGNPMAAMAAMAAAGVNPMSAMGSFGGGTSEGGGQPVPPAVAMARMKVAMTQAATDMQIAKTVSSSSLAKLSDTETNVMTDGQFLTTKDFVVFMQSSTTDIKSKQEQLQKVRNFLPPQEQEKDLFILEQLIEKQVESKILNGDMLGNKNGNFLPSLEGPKPYDPNMPEKDRLKDELYRLRNARRDFEARKELLINKAKLFQARAAKFKEKLADLWEQKLLEELENTGPLEQECAVLRDELDVQHKKRLEALEIKIKPIIIKDGPSKKANYKIMAARLHYEIYALTQHLRLTTIRAEHEQARRERREREVRRLRQLISEKKTTITTATKGIPFSKLEVRPQEQQPSYSGPIDTGNPLLSGMPNATLMATGRFGFGPMFGVGTSSLFSLPNLPGLAFTSQQSSNMFANAALPRIGIEPQFSSETSTAHHKSSIPNSAAAMAAAAGGLAGKPEQLNNGRTPHAIQTK